MATKNGTVTLFVQARHGEKSKSRGQPWGMVETVVVENEGRKAQVVTMFCDPSVAEAAEGIKPLSAIECEFEQRMTGNGPRSQLIGIRAAE